MKNTTTVNETYYVTYAKCVGGYALQRSRRAGTTWQSSADALPAQLAELLDRKVYKNRDKEVAHAYENIFIGGMTDLRAGDFTGTVVGCKTTTLADYRYTLKIDVTYPRPTVLLPAHTRLMRAIADQSTGRWDWDRANLCISGKNADLDDGSMAAEIEGVKGNLIYCVGHLGATFSGANCLETDSEMARDAYLSAATNIICGCDKVDWSGDDWYASFEVPFVIRQRATDELTASAIAKRTEEVLRDAATTVAGIRKSLDDLARECEGYAGEETPMEMGWVDSQGRP